MNNGFSDETKEAMDMGSGGGGSVNMDLLLDVELPVSISFGYSEMALKDILKLGTGSVIELDKSVNDPVTIIVNHKPIAKGEVVMVDGNYRSEERRVGKECRSRWSPYH